MFLVWFLLGLSCLRFVTFFKMRIYVFINQNILNVFFKKKLSFLLSRNATTLMLDYLIMSHTYWVPIHSVLSSCLLCFILATFYGYVIKFTDFPPTMSVLLFISSLENSVQILYFFFLVFLFGSFILSTFSLSSYV